MFVIENDSADFFPEPLFVLFFRENVI